MKTRILIIMAIFTSGLWTGNCLSQDLPAGYWNLEQANAVLAKTRTVVLDPDISSLTGAEQAATDKLIKAGVIINRIYEDSLHSQALESLRNLNGLHTDGKHTAALLDIYYRSSGPVTTTLDNKREAFLPVKPEEPGKNVYPGDMTTDLLGPFLEKRPELAAGLLNVRTVVRANTDENISRDLAMLDRFPVLDGLHPGLRSRLEALGGDRDERPWYALPYSVHWAPDIIQASDLIAAAAQVMEKEDPDFAAYLSLRARDLLSDDYEGGDAAWVRGRFNKLNAQIGSYEVYADSLYGVKSFFSLNVLIRDAEKS